MKIKCKCNTTLSFFGIETASSSGDTGGNNYQCNTTYYDTSGKKVGTATTLNKGYYY